MSILLTIAIMCGITATPAPIQGHLGIVTVDQKILDTLASESGLNSANGMISSDGKYLWTTFPIEANVLTRVPLVANGTVESFLLWHAIDASGKSRIGSRESVEELMKSEKIEVKNAGRFVGSASNGDFWVSGTQRENWSPILIRNGIVNGPNSTSAKLPKNFEKKFYLHLCGNSTEKEFKVLMVAFHKRSTSHITTSSLQIGEMTWQMADLKSGIPARQSHGKWRPISVPLSYASAGYSFWELNRLDEKSQTLRVTESNFVDLRTGKGRKLKYQVGNEIFSYHYVGGRLFRNGRNHERSLHRDENGVFFELVSGKWVRHGTAMLVGASYDRTQIAILERKKRKIVAGPTNLVLNWLKSQK